MSFKDRADDDRKSACTVAGIAIWDYDSIGDNDQPRHNPPVR
jgi:hypothetical protein